MALFKHKKIGLPPHTWYPEILHWEEGDRLNCWNIGQAIAVGWKFDWGTYKKYSSNGDARGHYMFTFKSVDQFGKLYVTDDDGHLVEFHFFRFIKYARNETLKTRMMNSKVNDSQDYMELMSTFQKAFNELQEADNHPKRLGTAEEESSKSS